LTIIGEIYTSVRSQDFGGHVHEAGKKKEMNEWSIVGFTNLQKNKKLLLLKTFDFVASSYEMSLSSESGEEIP
jgi:hypothetical protein